MLNKKFSLSLFFFFVNILSFSNIVMNHGCTFYIKNFPEYSCEKEDTIGTGAKGSAFLILKDGKNYILKVQPVSEKSEKEGLFLNRLRDVDGIVQLYEEKIVKNIDMKIIEYGANGTLVNLIAIKATVNNYALADKIMKKLVDAVREMHSRNIIHADLKPENIVLDDDLNPIIIDFDLATEKGELQYPRGTRSYMPPEIFKMMKSGGKIIYDEKVDIYSLGVIYFAMIKNKYPIKMHNNTYDQMLQVPIVFKNTDRKFLYDFCYKTISLKKTRIDDDGIFELITNQYLKPDTTQILKSESYNLLSTSFEIDKTSLDTSLFNTVNQKSLSTNNNKEADLTYLEIFVIVFMGVLLISVLILIIWFGKSSKKKFISPAFDLKDKKKDELNKEENRNTTITFSSN